MPAFLRRGSPFKGRGTGAWRGRGPFAALSGAFGQTDGVPWAIDATGAQIRAAIADGSYRLPGTAGAVLTFARNSVALQERQDGVWEEVSANVPAVDWVSSVGAYGLRVNETRTNRALWSRDLTNGVWVASNASPTKTATGIDGSTNSASTVTASADGATILQAITHTSTARTLSMFLRRRTGTGTVETTINGGTTWVERTLTSSWQRFTTTATLANPSVGIRIATNGDAVDVDVVQCEDGAFATSPHVTTTTATARAADAPTVTLGAWFGATQGTIVVDYVNVTTATGSLVSTDDGSTNNRIITFTNGGTTPAARVVAGGVDQANMNLATVTAGTLGRIAFGFEQDNFAASINGAAASTDTSGSVPTGQTTMRIGTNVLTLAALNGHITRMRYFARRISNSTLRALSA